MNLGSSWQVLLLSINVYSMPTGPTCPSFIFRVSSIGLNKVSLFEHVNYSWADLHYLLCTACQFTDGYFCFSRKNARKVKSGPCDTALCTEHNSINTQQYPCGLSRQVSVHWSVMEVSNKLTGFSKLDASVRIRNANWVCWSCSNW